MSYNYKIAKDVLSDKDKERLVCVHLNRRTDGSTDWDKAAAEFDCASVASMQVMTRGTLKKIADAGGKLGEGGEVSTPKTKAAGKKRKTAAAAAVADEEDEESTPVVKKSKGRDKKAAAASVAKEEPASGDED